LHCNDARHRPFLAFAPGFDSGRGPEAGGGGLMRVLVIDPDAARAQQVCEGLSAMRPLEVVRAPSLAEAGPLLHGEPPDVVVIACDSPDRDTLESLRITSAANPRPVVMFVDRSGPGLARAALEAGVAAYVVDGLAPARVQAIVETAIDRFRMTQAIREDLEKAKSDLAHRKVIERAKGVLMKMRGLDEEAAYQEMRRLAMNTGRPLHVLAADLLAVAGITERKDG
jgi:response regulator NasT